MEASNIIIYPLAVCVFGLSLWAAYRTLSPRAYKPPHRGERTRASIQVLVLGDLGRSPRMTYHAISIAKHGATVDLVGYLESNLHPDLLQNPKIRIHALPAPPKRPGAVPFLIFGPLKVLVQLYHLTWLLSYGLEPARWLIVQNPPSIPTLFIASLVCYVRNTRLMIDWHNYGWTILAGTRGSRHPLVHLSKAYECLFGKLGHFNLTVTNAMGRQLRQPPYSIVSPMLTVHDRPAKTFQPINSPSERTKVLTRILPDNKLVPRVLAGNTRLIVSSTSWTPDEDFLLMLDALVQYANSGEKSKEPLPPVLAIITGKGPQQAMYLEKIAALQKSGSLPNITIETAFLPFPDYAALLACADLGICLHKSSSGVDLPMKVVDMFGAGLPVAAYSGYESFGELVRVGVNGQGFETSEELAAILSHLLGAEGDGELRRLKAGAVTEGRMRWDEEWDATVAPALGLVS